MGRALDFKLAATAVAVLGAATWMIILAAKGINVPFEWEAIKEIPAAAGYVATLVILFVKWGWRIPIFHGWFVLVPDLNGTWKGKINSLWINPDTGKTPPPIDAYLVIRQSLDKISCILLTGESRSISHAATVLIDDDHQLKVLELTYTNSPRVSVEHRSTAHDGAAVLDVITSPKRKLIGKYWTDRTPAATKGEMNFDFQNRKHRQTFQVR